MADDFPALSGSKVWLDDVLVGPGAIKVINKIVISLNIQLVVRNFILGVL